MIDPTFLGALTAGLEKAVNAALRYDPGTRAALAKLSGRCLAVESTLPPVVFYLQPQPEDAEVSLAIHAFCEETQVDTRLKGNLPAILALTFGSQHSLANSGVEVTGDSGLLSSFQNIMANLDIDWEEPVTELMGSTLSFPLLQLMRNQWQWGRSSAAKARSFSADYLTEELRVTPNARELEHFYDAVDALRSDAERLKARVQRLQQQSFAAATRGS